MIDELRLFVQRVWDTLPTKESVCEPSQLRFTKFCQRVASPHTKVMFFVTYRTKPLCILKMMRSADYNDALRRERDAEQKAGVFGQCRAPRVYGDGLVLDRYVYAEEALYHARPLTRREAFAFEKNIIESLRFLPKSKEISARTLADVLMSHIPDSEPAALRLVEQLKESTSELATGFTHGDLGTPNILLQANVWYVIDWEHAGAEPFWLMDGLYFSARLRHIGDLADWQKRGRDTFVLHTGVTASYADALFCLKAILSILRKRHPAEYRHVVIRFRELCQGI